LCIGASLDTFVSMILREIVWPLFIGKLAGIGGCSQLGTLVKRRDGRVTASVG
jgi:hypothetical protein